MGKSEYTHTLEGPNIIDPIDTKGDERYHFFASSEFSIFGSMALGKLYVSWLYQTNPQ